MLSRSEREDVARKAPAVAKEAARKSLQVAAPAAQRPCTSDDLQVAIVANTSESKLLAMLHVTRTLW